MEFRVLCEYFWFVKVNIFLNELGGKPVHKVSHFMLMKFRYIKRMIMNLREPQLKKIKVRVTRYQVDNLGCVTYSSSSIGNPVNEPLTIAVILLSNRNLYNKKTIVLLQRS